MESVYRHLDMGPPGAVLPAGPFLGATLTDGVLDLICAAGSVQLPFEWLRDNCLCDRCRIVQTDERRLTPWTWTDAPQATACRVADGELIVDWADEHRTTFTADDWDRIRRAARRGAHTVTLWKAGYELGRFEYDEVLADSASHLAMFEAFRRDGAVVVTDAPQVPGTVVDFARSIGLTLIDSSLGFLFDVVVDPAGYNIAFTNEGLPPHNDNAQYLRPPGCQILSMVVNEASGGETIVVDGWSVAEQLRDADPAAIEVLSRVEVGFRQYSTTADGFGRSPLVVTDPHGRFSHLRFSNQLMQPLPFDHPRLAEWYRAYRALGRAITDPANQVHFRLQSGEMLFVNGYRMLHARTAFVTDGPRHLQDVYFNIDDVHSVIAMLTGEATNAMVHV